MPEIPHFYFDSLPPWGDFVTNPKLTLKADDAGYLNSFAGETTVFLLGAEEKAYLKGLQDKLYAACGAMLSKERLIADSFHMTLHDLWNEGEEHFVLPPYSHEQVLDAVESIRRGCHEPIQMRCVSMLNMVNTSVVLGLVPAADEGERMLDDMYSRIEAIYPLERGLTPHITLAYYRPGTYREDVWGVLREVFPIEETTILISPQSLVFQRFESMNRYFSIEN